MITGRITQGSGSLLYGYFYVDGVLTSASAAVTVAITGENGTSIAAGTATSVAVGTYSFPLATQSDCDILTVAWTGNVAGGVTTIKTRVEIVGGRYCTLSEVRAQDGLSDTAIFPVSVLEDAVRWAEDTIDKYVGVPFTLRYNRERLTGNGGADIRLREQFPYRILGVKENGTAAASVSWVDWTLWDAGAITKDTGSFASPTTTNLGGRNVEIRYEHGHLYPPDDIAWCARTLARYYCVELFNRMPDRATAVTNEFGTVNMAMAGGPGRPTGLPEVNAILNRYRSGGGLVVG